MKTSSQRRLRVLLSLLLLCNMLLIFGFSSQTGETSGATSSRLTHWILSVTTPDLDQLPLAEQTQILEHTEHLLRKLAHMTEFGCLGLLFFLLTATWEDGYTSLKYLLALSFVFFYAATDELHQTMVASRAGVFSDVLIDLSGAILTCTAALPFLLQKQKRDSRSRSRKDL